MSSGRRQFLKYPIDYANLEMHMPVQTGAEAVDTHDTLAIIWMKFLSVIAVSG